MMKFAATTALLVSGANAVALNRQPVITQNLRGEAKRANTDDFGPGLGFGDNAYGSEASDDSDKGTRNANGPYRNAWQDCGGLGASDTLKTRQMAARIKGQKKVVKLVRHAAQDATWAEGGPVKSDRVSFPGEAIAAAYRKGMSIAEETLGE